MRNASVLRVCGAISWVTFREILRDKILYNIILVSVLLLGLGLLGSKLTWVRADRIVLDFGIAALNLSCAAIAIMIGASMINREIERRTILVALSHPVSRLEFVIGKFFGLVWILVLNWLLLSLMFLLILALSGGRIASDFHLTLFWGIFLVLWESIALASVTVVVSTVSTTSLTAVIGIGFYLIGVNLSQLRLLALKTTSPLAAFSLKALALALPDFELFNLGSRVTYGIPVPISFVASSVLYSCALTFASLLIAGFLIDVREV